MTAVAYNQAYQEVGKYTSKFDLPHYGHKSVTNIKKAICLTTDKESVEDSKELLEIVTKIQSNLPVEAEGLNIDELNQHLSGVNENLGKLNGFLDSIKNLFDTGEIEIDDENMIYFLSNIKKCAKGVTYISNYLQLLIDVYKNKNSEDMKTYTVEQLVVFLKTA